MRAWTLLLGGIACSGGDEPTGPSPDGETPTGTTDSGTSTAPFDPVIETTDNGDGTFTTLVQATHGEQWVYLSLGDGAVRVEPVDPADSDSWDLMFRRDKIYVNGGVNGTGAAEAAVLPNIAFESVAWPAAGGYVTDTPDADGDEYAEGPFIGWFLYDITTHILTAADKSYVVRAPGGTFRVRLLSYYHPTGDQSGWPSFVWAPLDEASPGPVTADGAGGLRIATADGPVRLALAEQIALAPPDPDASAEWDLWVDPTTEVPALRINGGISGPGDRSAAAVDAAFEAVTEAPGAGTFVTDAADAAAIDGWVVDDGKGPSLVPDRTFVVRRPAPPQATGEASAPVDTKLAVTGLDADGLSVRVERLP